MFPSENPVFKEWNLYSLPYLRSEGSFSSLLSVLGEKQIQNELDQGC